MNIILFDDFSWDELLPLTFTRPVSEIRIGILTIREKWEKLSTNNISYHTRAHLQEKFPINIGNDNLLINSCLLPDKDLCKLAFSCPENMAYINEGRIFIARMNKNQTCEFIETLKHSCNTSEIDIPPHLSNFCDIFSKNGVELENDFQLITKGRKSQKASNTNQLIIPENIFIEEGAIIECSTLNASNGSIYIGKDSEIMEGSNIRGPFALCEHSAVKLGAKIYGPTTIGPYSKVGGEINNSVIFGFTNKAHDGFLGNSVIGEWCNIGADSNNSNLKNNYSNVKMWNYSRKQFANTGLLFAGLIMGDHSKCGINTMFNTGTVVGVSANLFGAGFHRNFIPSFSWGGPSTGYTTNQLNKSLEVAKVVFSRRNLELSETDTKILAWIHEYTEKYRQMQSE
ncbi:MAG: GlmU family protein [Bacteroidia bacterium]|nr:GlmU family protein [Bacteroidia bacterium]